VSKVLFINPVVREEDSPKHVPYGMALLAAVAIDKGHQVAVYDANAWRQPLSKAADACRADDWDVICIGGLTTTYGCIKQCFRIASESSPKSLLVAGGGFLTSMPKEMMEFIPEIDIGIVGEAYNTFIEVLDRNNEEYLFNELSDRNDIKGIIYREDGEIILNDARPLILDLDTLPHPAWHLFPLEEVYFKNSSSLFSEDAYLAKRRIDINGSYGCSLICRYCWHLGTTGDMAIKQNPTTDENEVIFSYARNIRYHSVDYIVDMVGRLKRDYGIDFANFLDENLMTVHASSGKKFLFDLCEAWGRAGLLPRRGKSPQPGVFWSGTSHASLHSPEVLKSMYEAGCTHLVYGLESFDPKVLKKMGKGTTRQKNIDSVGVCMKSGIIPIPNIIIGFPEETFESIRNTITALIELGIHAKPHFATAYPGSEWYYNYKQSIIDQYSSLEDYILDLGDATKITGTISTMFSGVELLGLQEIVTTRNLRLLDQFEAAYTPRPPLVTPEKSFNFKPSKN